MDNNDNDIRWFLLKCSITKNKMVNALVEYLYKEDHTHHVINRISQFTQIKPSSQPNSANNQSANYERVHWRSSQIPGSETGYVIPNISWSRRGGIP